MGLFGDNRGAAETTAQLPIPEYEHFPTETYSVACAVAISRDDLNALRALLENETATATAIEQSTFLSRVLNDELQIQQTEADFAAFMHELVETWESQMGNEPAAVWWPLDSDWRAKLYLQYCTARAEHESDEFEFSGNIERVRTLISRCEAVAEDDAKRGIVHKDHIPGEEPEERD
ncbi:hypothetical protein [Halostagnicola bangensis]